MYRTLSWRNIPTARTLFAMVFMAGIGLIISVVALLYLSLHLISTKTNEIDEHRTALSVQGAIQTSVNRVSSLVLDNAVWDDAVREAYRPTLDTDWLYNTWGAGFKINNLYDGTFVLDEHFEVIWGSFQSQPFQETNLDFFGKGLKALIAQHARALSSDKNIYAGISKTRSGVAFVGIGLIRPMVGRLQVTDETRRYLVITRHLNARILADLGATFQIDNLHFTPEKINEMSMPLRSSAGELLGYLNWQARLPGAQAARAASSDITQIVVLASALILLFILVSSVGDDLIVAIAKTLSERVPPGGMLARMGGDEFAMTIGDDEAETQATAFAVSVLDFLTTPIQLGERTIHIGASIGIASGTLIECTSSELFRRADIAMYHAKMSGKGRITHYDAELNSARERKLAIENQIRNGLERDEFEVWYQPIIDARSQKMSSVEALVRWPRRPDGPLGPDTFIAIAETSGLIYKLGQFVLQRACQDLQPYGDLTLSVNISPAQFRDPAFEDKVASVLETTHFPANRLQLEVTESYVLENPERARMAIANLKALGTAVALDDFGTGYSSIGYLRRFNFDTIKIDKSLAGLVDNDEQAAALVSGTVRIANALGMAVVAEGVETERQMKLLRLAGCDQLQGFWFSQPMPIESIRALHQVRRC